MNRIKVLRNEQGMRQADLAARLNITTATVSKYELGQRDIDSATLLRLCDIFDCSADYLLGRSEYRSSQFSEMELGIISAYRKADDHVKDLVRLALDPYWEEKQSAKAI